MNADLDIAALQRAVSLLQAAGDAGVQAIGHRFAAWLDGRAGERLDQAIGVGLPGKRSVTTLTKIRRRDELIAEAARQFFPTLTPTNRARRISHSMKLYSEGRWRRGDSKASQCPIQLSGTLYQLLWESLRCRDLALSARQVRKILALSSPHEATDHCETDSW